MLCVPHRRSPSARVQVQGGRLPKREGGGNGNAGRDFEVQETWLMEKEQPRWQQKGHAARLPPLLLLLFFFSLHWDEVNTGAQAAD